MSKVSCIKVNPTSTSPEVVCKSVQKALDLIGWETKLKPGGVVLKVNSVWDKIYPSCVTTPMVIEGVIKVLLKSKKVNPKKIFIVDTDTPAILHADKAFIVQGYEYFENKYRVKLINLTKTDFRKINNPAGLVLKKLKISKILLEADNIISIPVLKTHSFSELTGALKNQWGCIHDLRHNHHLHLHPAIADVNKFFKNKIRFAVMDGLFGMEGRGPKTGKPKKIGYIFASTDLVSLDSAVITSMGFSLKNVPYITLAQKIRVGSTKYEIVGNQLPLLHFLPPKGSNIAMETEMRLRKLGPQFEHLFFAEKSPFLFVFRWTGKIYYDFWYFLTGKKIAEKMMRTNYGKMWSARYLNNEKN